MTQSKLEPPSSSAWWAFDPAQLVEQKDAQGLTISVCLPARDEAATVGDIVSPIRRRLIDHLGLVDELVVVDDASTDATAATAMAAGADVVPIDCLLPDEPPGSGKGNVIWRSLAACTGDLVCWVDADIKNFELHFITGLLGPLLADPAVSFVKGHYRRPLDGQPTGGGRVSELVARPLLSRFFPELAGFAQPLAGEYAGRRALLESMPIVEGWGVEIGLLIDAWRAVGLKGLAQVDLGVREHRNRPLDELAEPAMAVLTTVLARAGVGPVETSPELLRFAGEAGVVGVPIPFVERPPIATRAGYRPQPPRPLPPVTFVPPAVPEPSPAPSTTVDHDRIVAAVHELLEALGEDPTREGLLRTPERVARMYAEVCSGLTEDPARHLDVRFEADHDELVLVRDIPFSSLCEHHLMPFIGRAHLGYIPGVDGRITGLSKLARLVEGFARRPQVQARLTSQVADALVERLTPRGVIVVIEAEHLCMTMRGVRKPGAITVTSAVRGLMRDDASARAEVMSIIHGPSSR
jgi:GTP cyclohydrolase I